MCTGRPSSRTTTGSVPEHDENTEIDPSTDTLIHGSINWAVHLYWPALSEVSRWYWLTWVKWCSSGESPPASSLLWCIVTTAPSLRLFPPPCSRWVPCVAVPPLSVRPSVRSEAAVGVRGHLEKYEPEQRVLFSLCDRAAPQQPRAAS